MPAHAGEQHSMVDTDQALGAHKAVRHLLVRQAMSQAIPFDQIIENVYQGRAVRHGSGIIRLDRHSPDRTGRQLL